MLHQRLSQKQTQKLSPQQIQLMKMLQIPAANLEQRVKEEIEANPALEQVDNSVENDNNEEVWESKKETTDEKEEVDSREEIDMSEYYSDDDEVADYKLRANNYSKDDDSKVIPVKVKQTFHENLTKQLGLQRLDDRKKLIADQLIGSIGDDGYLRRDLLAIEDDLAFSININCKQEELEAILEIVQSLDPPGVGARNLQECLKLQLERKLQTLPVRNALRIIEKQFDAFAKKHFERLSRSLKLTDEDLKLAMDEILKLNPKPGGSSGDSDKANQYIIPDFIITNEEGELILTLNARNAPDLRISGAFKELIDTYAKTKKPDKEAKQAILFIKQKIDSAKWFIEAIKQRQNTLFKTMSTLMKYQYDFFLTGDETAIKPMILKDIADKINMDISTVSRVANSKYVQTEFGVYSLKYFFSESLSTESGEEVSTREVKKILRDMIEEENKEAPLSDQMLMESLKLKGYHIARRTVAKYREQLNIPVARLRKEL